MILVFYSMVYLSICKDYERISIFYFLGMVEAFILAWILRYKCGWGIAYSMLFFTADGISVDWDSGICRREEIFYEEQRPVPSGTEVFYKMVASGGDKFLLYPGTVYP